MGWSLGRTQGWLPVTWDLRDLWWFSLNVKNDISPALSSSLSSAILSFSSSSHIRFSWFVQNLLRGAPPPSIELRGCFRVQGLETEGYPGRNSFHHAWVFENIVLKLEKKFEYWWITKYSGIGSSWSSISPGRVGRGVDDECKTARSTDVYVWLFWKPAPDLITYLCHNNQV